MPSAGKRKCPSGKRRFVDQLAAERALARAQMENWRGGKPQRREQRAYFHPTCGYWHLTSQPKED